MNDVNDLLQGALIVQRVLEKVCVGVFDREKAWNTKGYDALVARRLFDSYSDLQLVIVSEKHWSKRGLRKIDRSPVMYYRKAKAGRYGRNVQTCCVEAIPQ